MSRIRLLTIGFIALVSIFVFAILINQMMYKSRAAGETVNVSFAPSSGNVQTNTTNTAELLFTVPEGKGIAGIDVKVLASNIKILSLSNAEAVGKPGAGEFTEITSDVAADGASASKATVVIAGDDKLAANAKMQISYTCIAPGSATLSVDTSAFEVVGNIEGNVYSQGTIGSASFNCTSDGGGTSPTPTSPVSGGPSINARIVPAAQTAQVGSNMSYNVAFDGAPTGKGVSAIDIKLKYDPSLVEVSTIGEFTEGGVFSPAAPISTTMRCVDDSACKICADVAGTNCINGKCINNACDFTGNAGSPTPTVPPVCPAISCAPPQAGCTYSNPTYDTNGCMTSCGQLFCPISPTIPAPTEPIQNNTNCTQLVKTYDNTAGTAHISYVCIMSADKLPKTPRIPISFKAKTIGTGSLAITSAKVTGNIDEDVYVVKTSNGSYTITDGSGGVTPTPSTPAGVTPTPTTGAGEEGKVKVNLKLRFQGIVAKPDSRFTTMTVKCSVGDGGLFLPQSRTATFTAGDNGFWTGRLAFDVPAGNGYKILCKGPKHLQKKICDAKPSESFPGTYSCDKGKMQLIEGENTLDFTGITLLSGDLPNQDGIVNAYDTSLVVNSLDKEDAESVRLADLNLDGKVNAIDHSLVIAALSIRHDEL